ncbi:MAG TPA: hypothetical protein VM452_00725 [Caulifigura sp.]|nr:hypothetical protein [Caulifigura sp.]
MGRLLVIIGVLGVVAVASGCGGVDEDALHPLSGSATYNGEPIDLGSIAFIPAGGGSGSQRASGAVIQNGTYQIPQEKGLNTGTYRVEVRWLKKTGRELTDPMSGDKYDERKEALPAKFHAKSDLTIEIPAPENQHDISLSGK